MYKLWLIYQLPMIDDIKSILKYLWLLKEHWELIRHLKFLCNPLSLVQYHGIKIRNPPIGDTPFMDIFYYQNEFLYHLGDVKRKMRILTLADVINVLLNVSINNWIYITTYALH